MAGHHLSAVPLYDVGGIGNQGRSETSTEAGRDVATVIRHAEDDEIRLILADLFCEQVHSGRREDVAKGRILVDVHLPGTVPGECVGRFGGARAESDRRGWTQGAR